VLSLQGRTPDAVAAIANAVQLYEAKANAVPATRAQALLEELPT
jgi:hypothetical protein